MPAADIDTATREHLTEAARACRILDMEGHGDMTLGHLSVRASAGQGFWMKRNQIGLGEVLGPDDFVLVDWDGRQLAGSGGRHSEWPIHSEIFRARTDVNVVVHSHPFYASVFSAATEPLQPYTLDADYFIDVPRHEDEVALITTKSEGEAVARSLGQDFRRADGQSWRDVLRHQHRARGLYRDFPRKGLQGPSHRPRRGFENQHAEPGGSRQAAQTNHDAGALAAFLALFLPQARSARQVRRHGGRLRLMTPYRPHEY